MKLYFLESFVHDVSPWVCGSRFAAVTDELDRAFLFRRRLVKPGGAGQLIHSPFVLYKQWKFDFRMIGIHPFVTNRYRPNGQDGRGIHYASAPFSKAGVMQEKGEVQ